MMSESEIETYLHRRVHEAGGEHRRVMWLGRTNAPDDRVMIPGNCFWVECKEEGGAAVMHTYPRGRAQLREHKRMREMGEVVYVFDSTVSIDAVIA